jgi:dTDP-L-rhamnose 4-epimerase
VATTLSAASGTGLAPVVSGRYRLGDVRHIVASPRRAAAELGFSAEIGPQAGITAFAHDPLR